MKAPLVSVWASVWDFNRAAVIEDVYNTLKEKP